MAALLALISLTSRGLITVRYVQDTFVMFDAMWRTKLGQAPHVDFASPIGQAYYWPFAILAALHDTSVTTLLRANVIVATFTVLLCATTLPRRTSPAVFNIGILAIAAVAMTPRDMDGGITAFSFLAPYNMWSTALAMAVPLLTMIPPRDEGRSNYDYVDGIALGILLSTLLYLKITFFIPMACLPFISVILGYMRWQTLVTALFTGISIIVGVEVVLHNNLQYLNDIISAAKSSMESGEHLRHQKIIHHVVEASAFGAILAAAICLADPPRDPGQWARAHWRALLASGIVMLAGAAVAAQAHPQHQFGISVAGLLVGLEITRRRMRPRERPYATRASIAWTSTLAVAALLPLVETASIVAHTIYSRSRAVCEIPALHARRPGLLVRSDMMISPDCSKLDMTPVDVWHSATPGGLPDERVYSTYQVQQLEEGIDLLSRHQGQQDVIFAVEFTNPYPFIFGSRPPDAAEIWWDKGRSYSERHHPDPDRLLNGVTLVMLAKHDWYAQDLWRIYGRYIVRDFVVIDDSPRWLLLGRTSRAATSH